MLLISSAPKYSSRFQFNELKLIHNFGMQHGEYIFWSSCTKDIQEEQLFYTAQLIHVDV